MCAAWRLFGITLLAGFGVLALGGLWLPDGADKGELNRE